MSHDWGFIGTWGIILGVHRCLRCGSIATEETLQEACSKP